MLKKKILVIGQVPPPFGGQFLMIERLLAYNYSDVELIHFPISFSTSFSELGRLNIKKILAIPLIWIRLSLMFFRFNFFSIYYAPAGPNLIAVLRDVFIISFARLFCSNLILHLHAGGGSQLYSSFNSFIKFFYRTAFFNPLCIIRLTDYSHGDEALLKPRYSFVIPNGIEDISIYRSYQNCSPPVSSHEQHCTITYLGAIYPERGITDLLNAALILKRKGLPFSLLIAGAFTSSAYNAFVSQFIIRNSLSDSVRLVGEVVGDSKYNLFMQTDIFCFPSKVPSETFGLVMVEAMQFKLPVVAYNWNGASYIVLHGHTGLLCDPSDHIHLSEALEQLIITPLLRERFGVAGRSRYLSHYSIPQFYNLLDSCFSSITS